MKINRDRLMKNVMELSVIGKNEAGGIDRSLSSEADFLSREWIKTYWRDNLKKEAETDAIANLWIRKEGREALSTIVFGSHNDAVPNGGAYDGALGVLAATEIMETLLENKIETRHPLAVVSFTGEEPNPYNISTLGSRVLSGRLRTADLKKLSNNKDGSPLSACIEKLGGDIEKADEILIRENEVAAFLELHIEQGKRLETMKCSSAAVTCITGIYRERITIIGEANHGGTTQMQDRHDALLAACELNLAFEKIVKKANDPEVVGTIGQLAVRPNEVSIIPGQIVLMLEIRTKDEAVKDTIVSALRTEATYIESRRGVTIQREVNLDQPAMYMDKTVVDAVRRGIKTVSGHEKVIELVSMAGHDAANMQRVTRAGMIFVKSLFGMSHCPEELSLAEDIEPTVQAMMEAILILDKELDV